MKPQESEIIYKWLGGRQAGRAHPLAMNLLANVADGNHENPKEVFSRYKHKQELDEELEKWLFQELYEDVLSSSEQHMLRLCALYREDISHLHVKALNEAVNDQEAFVQLIRRCLLTPNEREEWYYLHPIIQELTQHRLDQKSDEFFSDHEVIADAWLSQLKISGNHPSLPNIKATNNAFYHLAQAQSYSRFYELSDQLLSRNLVPELENYSRSLADIRNSVDNRHVLKLLVKLDPGNPKNHSFLGGTLEKLYGKGNKDALKHYQTAYKLRPKYPQNLAKLGRCLLSRKTPEGYLAIVANLDKETYKKSMDPHNISIYADCLAATGEPQKASELRQEKIRSGSRDAVFYNDEANYLLSQPGKEQKALEVIKKAEEVGCADEYTLATKTQILQRQGQGEKASELRWEQIRAGSRNAAFYTDEANYLLSQAGKEQEALEMIEKAEKVGCADEYTLAIKTQILQQQGRGEKASELRQEHIRSGSRNAVFYNDEANYLLSQAGKEQEALELIKKAEKVGCANEYTLATKTQIIQQQGRGEKASELRQEQIRAGSRNAVFYSDEANYLLSQAGKEQEALEMIEKVEKIGCADEYTATIKAKILRQLELR